MWCLFLLQRKWSTFWCHSATGRPILHVIIIWNLFCACTVQTCTCLALYSVYTVCLSLIVFVFLYVCYLYVHMHPEQFSLHDFTHWLHVCIVKIGPRVPLPWPWYQFFHVGISLNSDVIFLSWPMACDNEGLYTLVMFTPIIVLMFLFWSYPCLRSTCVQLHGNIFGILRIMYIFLFVQHECIDFHAFHFEYFWCWDVEINWNNFWQVLLTWFRYHSHWN